MNKNKKENKFNFVYAESLNEIVLMEAQIYDLNFKKHMHKEYAIGVTQKGIQIFNCKGTLYEVRSGGVMTFNSGDAHDGHSGLGSGLDYQILYINENIINKIANGICGEKSSNFHFDKTVQYDKKFSDKILNFFNILGKSEGNFLEVQDKFFSIMADTMIRSGSFSKEKIEAIKDNPLVKRATKYIRENASENITLDDIANEVGVSPYYFSRLFKKTTGFSPHNYLNQWRVDIVKDKLRTNISLAELAQIAGFSDQSHMNRRFKEMYGLTPGQYKKSIL